MKNISVLVALACCLTPTIAYSQPTHQLYSGKITNIFTSFPGNMPFRVTLNLTMDGCNFNFAFLETSHGNYQAYVSLLTTAAATGKTVNIWVTANSGGFCTLDELSTPF